MKTTNKILLVIGVAMALSAPVTLAGHATIACEGRLVITSEVEGPEIACALAFDLSSIPEGANVDLAELSIEYSADTVFGRSVHLIVEAIDEEWTASGMPSADMLEAKELHSTNDVFTIGENQAGDVNVTEIVKRWKSGEWQNRGFLLSLDANDDSEFVITMDGGAAKATLTVYFSQ